MSFVNVDVGMADRINRFLEQTPEQIKEKKEREESERKLSVARSIEEKLKSSLKPAGYYNIPKLLDDRRLEWGIPNGAFESQPGFDRVYIWQISLKSGETFSEGGKILMPERTLAYQRDTAPRGILISAGLKAMDALYSTGFELGHIVRFKKLSPFIMPVAEIDGSELTVMVVRDGDIVSSEDMASQIHSKHGSIQNVSKDSYDFRYYLDGQMTGQKIHEYYDGSY